MPSRNTVKIYGTDVYYHVYNRGVEKREIFLCHDDYLVFLSLLKRALSNRPELDGRGVEYEWLMGSVELVAFCLMPNHFHFLVYQIEIDGMTRLLRAVCSSYTTYFNKKYNRVGPLFQGIFKAINIDNDAYLLNITRYIHRNPYEYMEWNWSSLPYWLHKKRASWVMSGRLNEMSPEQYKAYINDDINYRLNIDIINKQIETI